jgi:NAD(P)-dependent dehydrogenase (short-subunit alcohol dehydrogenase family)
VTALEDTSRPVDDVVVIVTGGSRSIGRAIARELASRAYAIVVVYLDDQPAAEATVEEVLAAGGKAVAVRADLTDDLDVERVFTETIAAFGGVDVVVQTVAPGASLLYEHASRHLSRGAAIVSVSSACQTTPELAQRLLQRDITLQGIPRPDPSAADRSVAELLALLDRWRHQSSR